MARVLFISAHYDDEVIGAGGALLQHSAAGDDVHVVYLTDGTADNGTVGREAASRRHEACGILNTLATSQTVYSFERSEGFLYPDDMSLVQELIVMLRSVQPSIVYTSHRLDGHPDHEAAWALATRACRMAGIGCWPKYGQRHVIKELRGYEIWAPLRRDDVDVVLDITAAMSRKEDLIRLYESQQSSIDYARLARSLAAYRAELFGIRGYAECYSSQTFQPETVS